MPLIQTDYLVARSSKNVTGLTDRNNCVSNSTGDNYPYPTILANGSISSADLWQTVEYRSQCLLHALLWLHSQNNSSVLRPLFFMLLIKVNSLLKIHFYT